MKIDVAAARRCLKSYDFITLFREQLGWDRHQAQLDVPINGTTFQLAAVAQKRGFTAYVCSSIPDRATRLKIDRQVSKTAREHFVIYVDQSAGRQVWQWVRREPGKPLASRDHRFDASGTGDALIQRLEHIAIGLDEEESITVVDVAGRARAAFDVDKVTKKFYDRFKAEHAAFLKFIKGIKAQSDLEWYTSLMLNRLMFVYFIQRKGFLDGDADYLRNRLHLVREAKGKDKFQSFYRYFLVRLFHDGLGKHENDRNLDRELENLLGKVPYLNGGFFEVHQLEERNAQIDIPDKAFEKLFDFFDEFSWHLDERPLRSGNEINPDVVGFIFEKYINQKQMGAYYTKEDITEYISKNTIIPFLFDAAQKKCPIAFKPESSLWRLLRDDPDRYIYPAVRHGVVDNLGTVIVLPKEIEAGVANVAMRDGWNRPAAEPYALPTETWREHVARRQRCLDLRERLSRGEVYAINDLITLNVDIWQFARDAIVNSEGAELLRAFWQAIAGRVPERSNEKIERGISVLDPTCGSGAFLFAALRILETLYSDCLERMHGFVQESDAPKPATRIGVKPKHQDFRAVLAQIALHPNDRYFILKSIIIGNLFGVDIMEEAVEICKLRLFLKLVAQVERIEQIEPLPDIDFNIRAGNTLVGYATLAEIKKSQAGTLGFGASEVKRIEEDALAVEKCFGQFRAQQTIHGGKITAKDKQELRRRLAGLDAELDRYMAREYGADVDIKEGKPFELWKATHQPFHWFVEFYGIMAQGGFDIVIGNPPYVEKSKLGNSYSVKQYATLECRDIYAWCVERAIRICSVNGRLGMIIPVSIVSSENFHPLRKILASDDKSLWMSHFANRPGQLFAGAQSRLTIVLRGFQSDRTMFSTRYHRWNARNGERDHLLPTLRYVRLSENTCGYHGLFPKAGRPEAIAVIEKLICKATVSEWLVEESANPIFWVRVPGYFCQFFLRAPMAKPEGGGPARVRGEVNAIYCSDALAQRSLHAILNSSLYYQFFCTFTDGRHLNPSDIKDFPCDPKRFRGTKTGTRLVKASKALEAAMTEHTSYWRKSGLLIESVDSGKTKTLIDEIDAVLALEFGLSDDELDLVTNYDFKYRMVSEQSEDADE